MAQKTTDAATAARPMPVWLLGTIAGVFALLYAYAVWNAIGNLVAAVGAAHGTGLHLNALGWFIWIFAALFPVIVYAVALTLSRKRRAWQAALGMLMGLALVAVFWLDVVAYTALSTNSFYS